MTDSLVASLLKHIPVENRIKIIREPVKIMAKVSRKGVASTVAANFNLQLIRRNVALGHFMLQLNHMWPLFYGSNLMRPNIKEFDAKIYAMREQHSLHGGLATHFKISRKIAPKLLRLMHLFTRG